MQYIGSMELTQAQYERIESCFPVQRGNVSLSNLDVLNATNRTNPRGFELGVRDGPLPGYVTVGAEEWLPRAAIAGVKLDF